MNTVYKVRVDGDGIGTIAYPFKVKHSEDFLRNLAIDIARKYKIKPDGITFERTEQPEKEPSKAECIRIAHHGKVK